MKRLIAGGVLMVLVVCGCVWGYQQLDLLTQELTNHVLEADAELDAGDEAAAGATLAECYKLWRSQQALLGMLVRHNELDDIENLFLRAMQSLQDHELTQYRLQSRELQGMLQHLPEMERPSVQNIF